jgi:hypothetical protein
MFLYPYREKISNHQRINSKDQKNEARLEGLEPSTPDFGDLRSTN